MRDRRTNPPGDGPCSKGGYFCRPLQACVKTQSSCNMLTKMTGTGMESDHLRANMDKLELSCVNGKVCENYSMLKHQQICK